MDSRLGVANFFKGVLVDPEGEGESGTSEATLLFDSFEGC